MARSRPVQTTTGSSPRAPTRVTQDTACRLSPLSPVKVVDRGVRHRPSASVSIVVRYKLQLQLITSIIMLRVPSQFHEENKCLEDNSGFFTDNRNVVS